MKRVRHAGKRIKGTEARWRHSSFKKEQAAATHHIEKLFHVFAFVAPTNFEGAGHVISSAEGYCADGDLTMGETHGVKLGQDPTNGTVPTTDKDAGVFDVLGRWRAVGGRDEEPAESVGRRSHISARQ